jgi:hypothetical protein
MHIFHAEADVYPILRKCYFLVKGRGGDPDYESVKDLRFILMMLVGLGAFSLPRNLAAWAITICGVWCVPLATASPMCQYNNSSHSWWSPPLGLVPLLPHNMTPMVG